MMKPIITLLLAFFGTTTGEVSRQQYADDYQRIINAFKSHSSVAFEVSYHTIGSSAVGGATVKYYFKGKRFYYNAGEMEALGTEDYMIGVNNVKKTIVISHVNNITDEFMPASLLDTFLQKKSVNVSYMEKGAKGIYSVYCNDKNTYFNKMEMEFGKPGYLVARIRLYLSPEKAKAWADYEKSDAGASREGGIAGIEYDFA